MEKLTLVDYIFLLEKKILFIDQNSVENAGFAVIKVVKKGFSAEINNNYCISDKPNSVYVIFKPFAPLASH